MDFPGDENLKGFISDDDWNEEHKSLIHPFSNDENSSDSRSGTASSKGETQHKRKRRTSTGSKESDDNGEVFKQQEIGSRKYIRISSDSEEELAITEKKVKKKVLRAFKKHRGRPPKISEPNLMALLEKLNNKPKLSKQRQNQIECVQRLHSSNKPMWTSPSVVLKAVKDCILKRKWNNLTHLLLIMIGFSRAKYKPIIKYLCLLIDRLHPVVEENDMTGQFKLVYQAARR